MDEKQDDGYGGGVGVWPGDLQAILRQGEQVAAKVMSGEATATSSRRRV